VIEQQAQSLEQTERQLAADSIQQTQVVSLVRSIKDFARRVHTSLQQASFEQKRQLVELLIDRVIVTDDQIEICYVIPTSPASEQTHFYQLRTDYLERIRSHEVNTEIFARSSGTSGSDGIRAPVRARIAVGGNGLDRGKDRMYAGVVATMGATGRTRHGQTTRTFECRTRPAQATRTREL
jgi:hypothetical protein